MRWTGFKTKAIFTLGVYVLLWHAKVVTWLREEFQQPVAQQQTWRLFIPIYSWVVWWRYLVHIRQVEVATFGAAEFGRGMKPLSVGRAFFWSGMWFSGGPYVNRHLNALDAYRRGQQVRPHVPAANTGLPMPSEDGRGVAIGSPVLSETTYRSEQRSSPERPAGRQTA
jgi:hypothetical protein